MLFRVDPASAVPLFDQIAGAVRSAVVRGEVEPGDRLPSARELAESLDLNVHTVLHAYRTLREEGLVELRRGRGATISASAGGDYRDLRAALDTLVAAGERHGLTRQALAGLLTHEENS